MVESILARVGKLLNFVIGRSAFDAPGNLKVCGVTYNGRSSRDRFPSLAEQCSPPPLFQCFSDYSFCLWRQLFMVAALTRYSFLAARLVTVDRSFRRFPL